MQLLCDVGQQEIKQGELKQKTKTNSLIRLSHRYLLGKLKVNSDLLGDEINVDKKLVTCRETRGENIKNRSHFFLDIFYF